MAGFPLISEPRRCSGWASLSSRVKLLTPSPQSPCFCTGLQEVGVGGAPRCPPWEVPNHFFFFFFFEETKLQPRASGSPAFGGSPRVGAQVRRVLWSGWGWGGLPAPVLPLGALLGSSANPNTEGPTGTQSRSLFCCILWPFRKQWGCGGDFFRIFSGLSPGSRKRVRVALAGPWPSGRCPLPCVLPRTKTSGSWQPEVGPRPGHSRGHGQAQRHLPEGLRLGFWGRRGPRAAVVGFVCLASCTKVRRVAHWWGSHLPSAPGPET